MIKEIKKRQQGEPACQKRSDGDHLRFVIHKRQDRELKFDFTIELDGAKSWSVPEVPSMNPLDQRLAMEEQAEADLILYSGIDHPITETDLRTWDKGNYIPIDDDGNVLTENEALACLEQGTLKFFLQGKKLVGEFVLMKNSDSHWLMMKRHDEFALYNYYSFEAIEG
jgi:bifunctional non-homologous end joining protein LigD